MAAIDTTSLASTIVAELSPAQAIILEEAFNKLRAQLVAGDREPCVPFTSASILGEVGIKFLREQLEDTFGTAMTAEINLVSAVQRRLYDCKLT